MFGFEIIAERRIEEAMADGQFDDLELSGVPVDLTDYFNLPAELRMAWTVLKNANCVPREVGLAREIDVMRERMSKCTDETEKRQLAKSIQERETGLRMMIERNRQQRQRSPHHREPR